VIQRCTGLLSMPARRVMATRSSHFAPHLLIQAQKEKPAALTAVASIEKKFRNPLEEKLTTLRAV
jgi:hypothetical protein